MKMIVFMGMIFVLGVQPVLMISSLIVMISLYSIYIFYEMSSFWFSYMLMLVMLSGVLVVFTYMMSLIPNETFEISSLVVIIGMILFLYFWFSSNFLFMDLAVVSLKIWESISVYYTLYLISMLLGIMLMVVWMSVMSDGAVRIA